MVEKTTKIEANDMTGAVATMCTSPTVAFFASSRNQEATCIDLNLLFEPEQGFLLLFDALDHLIRLVVSVASINWTTEVG